MDLAKLLFFLLSFFSTYVSSQLSTSFNTSVIPITKDPKASLYKITWSGSRRQPYYLIDLDAPFTWKDCTVHRPKKEVDCGVKDCQLPLPCYFSFCKEARSYVNPICPSLNTTAKYGCDFCVVTPANPISKSCKMSQLTTDFASFSGTNGRNPSTGLFYSLPFYFSCAPSSLRRSLPKDVGGVVSFSWSNLALPRQVAFGYVREKFALCLPSSSMGPGVTFIGDGPFYLLPFSNLDVRSFLSYTPMLRRTPKSLGYYVKINRIFIQGKQLSLPLLKSSPVKLSTVVTYTTLRSDIYKALVTSFAEATKKIPRVSPVQPFGLCFKASAIGSVQAGFRVPKIDLEMGSGKNWTISGDNSMKRIGNGAACLAFVDGGLGVEDAIVIGSFQMENNFLFMDLLKQRLGFSSSLLARGTSCSNFNFTEISE
ncbi:hypothetical protein OSB04_014733 [Centaurea solstitialis]|uniref:Peptidase A1 domain-containing protein n=1 Tax=Centaurea solstitialis TaxID=347529 RepID=A0AA38THI9_9ASTR|nr:hypothetical protein OSB04_014733 [Centaurea solstitialis]